LIVGDYLKSNILLLGGSGTLGKSIIKSKLFKNLYHPSRDVLNILNQRKIESFLTKNKINTIIHCAALARVKECEKNKKKAYKINVLGTKNIVTSVRNCLKKRREKIKFVFISSDGVYPPARGNNRENDKLNPYNYYGKTKLQGENFVKKLNNYIIIRTRFFDKNNIKFKYAAINIFTSAIEVNKLAKYINKLLKKNFKGILNVGGSRISDYKKYKKYKKNIKPCDKSEIFKQINVRLASDASLNISKLKQLI
tara:strand:+ start:185 stop:943 length:759 start_codon:yes stop_codon:yes gene_type:complete